MAAPPGMEHVVRELKKDPDIDNPWAVAWSIYNRKKATMNGVEKDAARKRLLRSLIDWHSAEHGDEMGVETYRVEKPRWVETFHGRNQSMVSKNRFPGADTSLVLKADKFAKVGYPILDTGNFEFKTNPFKMGVEQMSNIGARADVVPGSYQPGGGWFRHGDWQPGGGYWVREDGTILHNPRSVGRVPRGTATARIRKGGGLAGWPRSFDPFKVGDEPMYDLDDGIDEVGAATYSWHPGGGAYDEYTGRYNPGGGWYRSGRGWVHSSEYDEDLWPSPGTQNFMRGWPNQYDPFKVGAWPEGYDPYKVGFMPFGRLRRRMLAKRKLRQARAARRSAALRAFKGKGSVFSRLKRAKLRALARRKRKSARRLSRGTPWMALRRKQRSAASRLLRGARSGDPRCRAALNRIRRLATSKAAGQASGAAKRILRDIAQIATAQRVRSARGRVSGWPRSYDPFKVGHGAGATHATGCAVMAQLASRK